MTVRATTVAGLAAAGVASAWLAWRAPLGADYPIDAGPPILALIEGDPGAFFSRQPLMGTFSLLLRAPFAAVAALIGGGEALAYRLGAFPCLLAAGLLAIALVRWMGERHQSLSARVVVGSLCLLNPITLDALQWGHPEEVLGGALCVGAVALAARGRPVVAGVLLGLALATKQWAVIAVLPALLASPRGRLRLALVAGVLAVALTAPLALGDPEQFVAVNRSAATGDYDVFAPTIWWPVASITHATSVFDGVEQVVVTRYGLPAGLARLTHPLIVLLPLPLGLLWWRRARRESRPQPHDALALLALLFLLRCVLDPLNIGYYHAPAFLALLAYEALAGRGLPVLSMLAATGEWLTFEHVQRLGEPALTNALYLTWTIPLSALLAARLYAPSVTAQVARRLRLSRPVSTLAGGCRR